TSVHSSRKTGSDDEPEEALLLPWDRFSAWLHCICVVGFDLELGQAVEVRGPTRLFICYLSFPDSNSGCLGDTQFCFRFRQGSNRKQSLSCFLENTDRDAPPCLKRELGHYYGYVYFRQVRDKSLKRGYFQKSLVLVSKLPYVTFFHSLLKIMAPEYFEKQEPCLEAACNDIDRWPTPHPGRILTLPIMGMVIKVPVFQCVWELVDMVTIFFFFFNLKPPLMGRESSFTGSFNRPSVILGVTNPFFAKTLQHWPHIIRIGDMKQAGEMAKQMKVKKLKNLKTLDSKPGVYTACKPYLNKDEEIIKQLQKGVQQKRPSAAQNAILRRYFLELTQSFIIPLERYVASLMPLQKSICPWKSPPQLHPFIQQDFMKTLEKAGPQLTSRLKGDWIGLYRNFLKSPNFDGWFRTRRREMIHKLEALHLEALCEEDLQQRVQKHSEVETVDLVLKLKDKLSQAEKEHLPVRPGTLAKLQEHIEAVILSLPEDLQGILHKPSTP
uniref:DENN/MADD domain containing 6Aa n=1 Tax=Takifugu rubripes TaxID=31033 RepID=A0A674NQS7_TAKRU